MGIVENFLNLPRKTERNRKTEENIMQSLIRANRTADMQSHYKLMQKVAEDYERAFEERLPLVQRYEISIQNMKLQLYQLQLSLGIKVVSGTRSRAGSEECDIPTLSSSCSSSDAPQRGSSDTIDLKSDSGSELSEMERSEEERKNQLVGKTVVGTLNISTSKLNGITRYFLNWSKSRRENILLDRSILEKFCPNHVESLRSGKKLECTITGCTNLNCFTDAIRRPTGVHKKSRQQKRNRKRGAYRKRR